MFAIFAILSVNHAILCDRSLLKCKIRWCVDNVINQKKIIRPIGRIELFEICVLCTHNLLFFLFTLHGFERKKGRKWSVEIKLNAKNLHSQNPLVSLFQPTALNIFTNGIYEPHIGSHVFITIQTNSIYGFNRSNAYTHCWADWVATDVEICDRQNQQREILTFFVSFPHIVRYSKFIPFNLLK